MHIMMKTNPMRRVSQKDIGKQRPNLQKYISDNKNIENQRDDWYIQDLDLHKISSE